MNKGKPLESSILALSSIIIILVVTMSSLDTQEVFGANMTDADVVEGRGYDYEITKIANYSYTTRLNLPPYVDTGGGNFVPYTHSEDSSGIEVYTGQGNFYFDKNSCTVSIYDTDEFMAKQQIEYQNWVLRVSPTSSENWTDIPENSLGCTIIPTYDADTVTINSTKSSVNATISQVYSFNEWTGLKPDLYFTNNNPAWNDHKFSWSNFLVNTPKSFGLMIVNQTNGDLIAKKYSTLSPANQPFQLDGLGTVLSAENISFNLTDFSINGTTLVDGFTLYPQQSVMIDDEIKYNFREGLDQFSELIFSANVDGSIDVRVDYANVTSALGIGETQYLDPTFNVNQVGARSWSGAFGSSCGVSSASSSVYTGSTASSHVSFSGGSESCSGAIDFYDISSIPDNATPTRWQLQFNQTGGSLSGVDTSSLNSNIYTIISEDLSGLSDVDLANCLRRGAQVCTFDTGDVFGSHGAFRTPIGGVPAGGILRNFETSTPTDSRITGLETQLESGQDFYQIFVCGAFFSTSLNGCTADQGAPSSRHNTKIWTRNTVSDFFEVDWTIFTAPSEPINVTASYSASPDTCTANWSVPLDDGGRPIDEYRIDRSIDGGSFTTLVSGTGSPVPTEYADSSISSGFSYKYKIYAINAEGTGSASEETESCGVPSIADPPTLTNVFEQPDGQLTLTWTQGFDGALPIDGFKIERRSDGGGFSTIIPSTGNDNLNFTDGTTGANIFYEYQISTINSLGTSSPSNILGFEIVVSGGGAGGGGGGQGSPVQNPTEPEPEVDVGDLLDLLAPSEQETLIQQVYTQLFEFEVLDKTHENVAPNSFLGNQELTIRWSSGNDVVITDVQPALSPFDFSFEALPVVKSGTGIIFSEGSLIYNLQTPQEECQQTFSFECVEKIRYSVPVNVKALINGTEVEDTAIILVDLTEDELNPILVILFATLGIPLVAGIVHKARGGKNPSKVSDLLKQ